MNISFQYKLILYIRKNTKVTKVTLILLIQSIIATFKSNLLQTKLSKKIDLVQERVGMCNTPDGNHLSSEIQLACAPFPNEGFFKFYTNSSDSSDKQIATSRCHSLRQPPGGILRQNKSKKVLLTSLNFTTTLTSASPF